MALRQHRAARPWSWLCGLTTSMPPTDSWWPRGCRWFSRLTTPAITIGMPYCAIPTEILWRLSPSVQHRRDNRAPSAVKWARSGRGGSCRGGRPPEVSGRLGLGLGLWLRAASEEGGRHADDERHGSDQQRRRFGQADAERLVERVSAGTGERKGRGCSEQREVELVAA